MKAIKNISPARAGLALAAIVVAAGAATGALARADKARELLSQYEKTGETVSCLSLRNVRDTDIVDDYAMLVEASGDVYLNELSGRCIGLSREGRYIHDSATGQMCRGDIIRVMDSFGRSLGGCGLGAFEKLKEIPQEE